MRSAYLSASQNADKIDPLLPLGQNVSIALLRLNQGRAVLSSLFHQMTIRLMRGRPEMLDIGMTLMQHFLFGSFLVEDVKHLENSVVIDSAGSKEKG
jgi:hypothetical protein